MLMLVVAVGDITIKLLNVATDADVVNIWVSYTMFLMTLLLGHKFYPALSK